MSKRMLGAAVSMALICISSAELLASDYIVEGRTGGINAATHVNYSETGGAFGDSTLNCTTTGCDGGINTRYCLNATGVAHFKFIPTVTAQVTAYATWGSASSGDTCVTFKVRDVTNNVDLYTTAPKVCQCSGSCVATSGCGSCGLGNSWVQLGGPFSFVQGNTYEVTQINADLHSGKRMLVGAAKFSTPCDCANVPSVATKGPHIVGDSVVQVTSVNANATAVKVYVNGVVRGTISLPGSGSASTQNVTLTTPLVSPADDNKLVVATQTMVACVTNESRESCVPASGNLVGNCNQIPAVTALPVIITGDATVKVSGVSVSATSVQVYAVGNPVALGTLASPVPSGADNRVTVSVSGLSGGQTIVATQTQRSVGDGSGNGAFREGCVPASGVVVDDPAQVGLVAPVGLVDANRASVRVSGVSTDPGTVVKVYDGTTLIGSSSSAAGGPDGSTVVVTVSPVLVEGHTIKATQTVHALEGNKGSGRRVMAQNMIEDFTDLAAAQIVGNPPLSGSASNRIWYNTDNSGVVATTPTVATNFLTSGNKAIHFDDNGGQNGMYAVYEQIIPADGVYHLAVDMLVDEATAADPAWMYQFQIGVIPNGAHRTAATAISPCSIVGNYSGLLTGGQDSLGATSMFTTLTATLGEAVALHAGDSLLIAFSTNVATYSHTSPTAQATPHSGMWIDNIRLNAGAKPCVPSDVPPVVVTQAPLEAGGTHVTLGSVNAGASLVSVYEYIPPSTWNLLKSVNPASSTSPDVVLDNPLVAGQIIVATQTMLVCNPQQSMEGAKTGNGPVVGRGRNTPLRIALGIRETGGSGPVGADGGATGDLEFVGATSLLTSNATTCAPQGKLVVPDANWQTLTFSSSVSGGSDQVLGFPSSGNGSLTGTWGVLENLAITPEIVSGAHINTGRYILYIDDVKNGSTTVADFEAQAVGTVAMFQPPALGSGTTSPNMLALPSVSTVDDTHHNIGLHSLRVEFQFQDNAQTRWLRLTTGSTTAVLRNPQIQLNQPVTLNVLLIGCNVPWADADGDGDVDQNDFGVFQRRDTGSASGHPAIPVGCDCLDHITTGDSNLAIDGSDLAAFVACAAVGSHGSGIPAGACP